MNSPQDDKGVWVSRASKAAQESNPFYIPEWKKPKGGNSITRRYVREDIMRHGESFLSQQFQNYLNP